MTTLAISLGRLDWPTGDLLDTEIVERKGLGHPDTLCDEVAEEFGFGLSRLYLSEFGQVLHYNVDKVLLTGGESSPRFGGGEITRPMELFLAGRATGSFRGKALPIEELARQTTSQWFAQHLPTVNLGRDLNVHYLVHPGSADLAHLFARQTGRKALANDTSCGVGFAPLSRLEEIVYAVEQHLGAKALDTHHEIGRDIKVLGVRRGEHIHLTIACALIASFVPNLAAYIEAKRTIASLASSVAQEHGAKPVSVDVNAADDLQSGSIYLTITGTSAEAGDDGEAGRGNRVNGLITPYRPMTMESVAGKNAVTHVGKLYNIVASLIAQRLVDELKPVSEAQCLIVSQIGSPIDEPQIVDVSVRIPDGSAGPSVAISAIVNDELSRIGSIAGELARRHLRVGRSPLRGH